MGWLWVLFDQVSLYLFEQLRRETAVLGFAKSQASRERDVDGRRSLEDQAGARQQQQQEQLVTRSRLYAQRLPCRGRREVRECPPLHRAR